MALRAIRVIGAGNRRSHFGKRYTAGCCDCAGVILSGRPVRCSGGKARDFVDIVRTVCPSGLRGWTQVPLAQAAWVQIPQLSYIIMLHEPCAMRGQSTGAAGGMTSVASHSRFGIANPRPLERGSSWAIWAPQVVRHSLPLCSLTPSSLNKGKAESSRGFAVASARS